MDLEMQLDASAVDFTHLNLNEHSLDGGELLDISVLVDELKEKDFISMLFLLLDYINPEKYLKLVSRQSFHVHKKQNLKQNFISIWRDNKLNESMLIEILGTIKAYKLLKKLGTCYHVFKLKKDSFHQISNIWKFLYGLCEEISGSDLINLKEVIKMIKSNEDSASRRTIIDSIDSAEEFFCYALVKEKLFSKNKVEKIIPIFAEVNPDCLPLIHSYIASVKKENSMKQKKIYEIKSGIAIIFNHKEFYRDSSLDEDKFPALVPRKGTDRDLDLLKKTWEMFGFETEVFNDLDDVKVIEKLKLFSKFDYSNYDAFVCCYLSHGAKGIVCASNSKPIEIDTLIDIMANHCPTLIGKPKLFIIQACQGSKIQRGISYDEAEDEENVLYTDCPRASDIPKFHNVFKVFSTYSGYASFRNEKGSWFVQEFANILSEFGHTEPITSIMERVTHEISKKRGKLGQVDNCKQICVCESTLAYSVMFKRKYQNA